MDDKKIIQMLEELGKDEDNLPVIEEIKKRLNQGDYNSVLKKINELRTKKMNKVERKEVNLNLDEVSDFTQKQSNEIIKSFIKNVEDADEQEHSNDEDDNIDDLESQYDFSENLNEKEDNEDNQEIEITEDELLSNFAKEEEDTSDIEYPELLMNKKLEENYIGMIVSNPKNLSLYAILKDDNYFSSFEIANLYRLTIFGEGQQYCPEKFKRGYNFAKESEELLIQKDDYKEKYKNRKLDIKKIYLELRKLFVLRKRYLENPIEEIQQGISQIVNYDLYDKMGIQEVEDTVDQIITTQKFKKSILNTNTTNFLIAGDNNLTNGLKMPFPILSECFKGIRKGETMSIAMPSNAGKSRLTTLLVAYIALVHKKKVLLISNEMSEDKMKLCMLTTIMNNKEIQKQHGIEVSITETELLDFKFRPDNTTMCKVDENGYVLKEENEKQFDFANRLYNISTTFKKVIEISKWFEREIENQVHFINITDHTNDELKKVIKNYYYKEKIEYMFYDTMKADTDNIGVGEELKKTATILSNFAQEFEIFIGSTLQVAESSTLPINLSIQDLSACKTVKEVLDILIMMKQIQREDLDKYEYTKNELDKEAYDLTISDDPNVRYYACVIDKNRAGAKPKTLFRINLAYNEWEELGYLRLKSRVS